MVFTEEQIQKVWENATIVSNTDPKVLRKDICGAWIAHIQYGNRNSKFGWEIDHITPESKGGTNERSNLRPLQWENSLSKFKDNLVCAVTSKGMDNVKNS